LADQSLDKNAITDLLRTDDAGRIEGLFAAARNKRAGTTGARIFTYGFVYFSTYCRNDCAFCYFRKSNDIERYRKSGEEVLELSKELADSGVNLIDLTMGEDPYFHEEGFESVFSLIRSIKKETGLPVMVSAGVVDDKIIDGFAAAGALWYALYQETHNRDLFDKLRLSQDYDERMRCKIYAGEKGLKIEEGIMSGVGESPEDIADSVLQMKLCGASQMRVMSFVPRKGSPMADVQAPDRMTELKTIAILRLLYPGALIPASLDVEGISGLKDRIDAGANLVTSIIPPKKGLSGVAKSFTDVDNGGRTVYEVSKILGSMNLRTATNDEYGEYLYQ
jgi:methylornithine synthase